MPTFCASLEIKTHSKSIRHFNVDRVLAVSLLTQLITFMKNVLLLTLSLVMFSFFTSCQKEAIDTSGNIAFTAPEAGATFKNLEEIPINAVINTTDGFILSYQTTVRFNNGSLVSESRRTECSKDEVVSSVAVNDSYLNDLDRNSRMYVEICADLSDGTTVCDTRDFRIEE